MWLSLTEPASAWLILYVLLLILWYLLPGLQGTNIHGFFFSSDINNTPLVTNPLVSWRTHLIRSQSSDFLDARLIEHILNKLKKGRVATDLRHHFFTERIVNTWNHLDTSVVEAETLKTFKSRLQRMHDKDESFLGRTTSYWLQRPSQSPWGGLIQWVIRWVLCRLKTIFTAKRITIWVIWMAYFKCISHICLKV